MHLSKENIFVIGDTHSLNYVGILKYFKLKDFVLIHVGDSGEVDNYGYYTIKDAKRDIQDLYDYCKENNGIILTVRGNHSDPAFFKKDHWTSEFEEFVRFVPDYTSYTINNKEFLFVGGAISVDRVIRWYENLPYWEDEIFVLKQDFESLPQCDVLVTHSSGIDSPPFGLDKIKNYIKNDPSLKEELIKERQDIQKLINHVNCSVNLYGHFHETFSIRENGVWYRCLDINEVLQLHL